MPREDAKYKAVRCLSGDAAAQAHKAYPNCVLDDPQKDGSIILYVHLNPQRSSAPIGRELRRFLRESEWEVEDFETIGEVQLATVYPSTETEGEETDEVPSSGTGTNSPREEDSSPEGQEEVQAE